MDRFRAIQYLVAAAEAASFSAAARRLKVSSTAVKKLVNSLERSLVVKLVETSARGLTLTSAGAAYAQTCSLLLRDMAEADELARASTSRTPGTVVVGVQQVIAQECLVPALPRFFARHPEIQLDIRDFNATADYQSSGIDVIMALSWSGIDKLVREFVRVEAGAARFIVLASPGYWRENGTPQRPSDLERHNCFAIRALDETIMDLWTFEREGVRDSVVVKGSVVASNAHRGVTVALALAGAGVIRILDWASHPLVAAGTLVPALTDWLSPEAPSVNIFYRLAVRRAARVRKFIDFATELLKEMTMNTGAMPSERPPWLNRHYGRSSVIARR
jgi:LysR family transcriptional regulator, regulator for bpeEF and oprC